MLSNILVLIMGLSVIIYAYVKDFHGHKNDNNDRDIGDW